MPGCAPAPPAEEPGTPTPPERIAGWRCEATEGGEPAWLERSGGWTSSAGILTRVVTSDGFEEPRRGADDRSSAVADAAVRAVSAACGQLAARGAGLALDAEARDRAAEELRTSGAARFPRVSLREIHVEQCVRGDSARYRAAALVEYPIALLRGDVRNAGWERRRLLREARVLSASAAQHLAQGRWADAALAAGRARSALEAAGATPVGEGMLWELGADAETITVVPPPAVRPARSSAVVPYGAPDTTRVEFVWTYSYKGRDVPAVGVPVRFRHGLVGVVSADGATGADGRGGVSLERVWSPPGRYTVTAGVDSAGLRRAGAYWRGGTSAAEAAVYVVEPGHGTSVCLELTHADPSDATQVLSGLERRLGDDGYDVIPCGPETDILVSGDLSLSATESDAGWTARVVLAIEAVDQRSAADLGSTEIVVEETTDRGRREAEVLVLKEAGRLAGIYLTGRARSRP